MTKPLRDSFIILVVGLILFAGAFLFNGQLKPIENLLYDAMMRYSAKPFQRTGLITLIDVDEASLGKIGQWPWPRDRLATIVERVNEGGALVLVFDAIFPEPDRMSPDNLMKEISEIGNFLAREEGALPSYDQKFSDAIRPAPVVLGQTSLINDRVLVTDPLKSQAILVRPNISLRSTDPILSTEVPPPQIPKLKGILSNIKQLDEAATGIGVVTLPSDNDGISRAMPMVFAYQDQTLPSLAFEALRVSQKSRGQIVLFNQKGISQVIVQGSDKTLVIPTDRNGQLWIRFPALPADEERYFDVVSAAEILDADFEPRVFENQIVLFGSSAAGLFDLKSTPLGARNKIPGMDLQALTIHQAIAGNMIRPIEAILWKVLAALIFLIYAATLISRFPSLLNTAIWLLCVAGIASLQLWFFLTQATFFSALSLLLFVLVFGAFALLFDLIQRDKKRREIKSAFAHYLSPALVNKISQNPEQLRLGGQRKQLSILFADLRGFTAVSETFKDDPETLTAIINGILTPLSDIVHAHQGTVDKYMGDCLMAFWNAPLDVENHAEKAINAAIAMIEAMPRINASLRGKFGQDGFQLGIGINSGEATVGNFGSKSRFDYSVLGDAVNLAARLEGQSKTYGINILVGHETYKRVKTIYFFLAQIDELRVKGKSEFISVYTPVINPMATELEEHRQTFHAYKHDDTEQAIAAIKISKGRFSGQLDPVYSLWERRRKEAERNNSGEWNHLHEAPDK